MRERVLEKKRSFRWAPGIIGALFFCYAPLCVPTIADARTASNELSYAVKLIQSAQNLSINKGGRVSFSIGFKNTSGAIWSLNDAQQITLRSSAKKESYFHSASWRTRNVVMSLPQKAKPGEIVYFLFTLEAPKRGGTYTEELALYRGNTKIAATVTKIPILVQNAPVHVPTIVSTPPPINQNQGVAAAPIQAPQAQPMITAPAAPPVILTTTKLIQSADTLTLKQYERVRFSIGYKNTSGITWSATDTQLITLRSSATKESYFYDPSWQSQNGVMSLPQDTKDGEIVYFSFTLFAPIYPGTYEEKLSLVQGDTKIFGSDVSIPITVVKNSSTIVADASGTAGGATLIQTLIPATPPLALQGIVDDKTEQEPLIRVGLFNTHDQITVTAQKDYEVRDSDGVLLTSESAGSVATVVFDWNSKAYTLTTPKASVGTAKFLRFTGVRQNISVGGAPAQQASIPDQDTIFHILSYTNRPSWSSSFNDNAFRGTLEVRYAPATDKLWAVNELTLENYLKGIGETSNSSPYEYQKALIVAARTYAKYLLYLNSKHAAEGFTVLTTEADQVYRGYNGEKRLPNVSRAVDETYGIIVYYGGKLAITPYYSQSDGRTRSWEEVWGGGPKPWLVGMPDPACSGLPMLGHGVGMSARGALAMALDNKGFEEILKYYYTGIELHRKY